MAIVQKENTIILEMGSVESDDIKDLRYGEGKLFNKIAKALEQLKTSGEVGENAQPIIAIVKKKSSKDEFDLNFGSPKFKVPKF